MVAEGIERAAHRAALARFMAIGALVVEATAVALLMRAGAESPPAGSLAFHAAASLGVAISFLLRLPAHHRVRARAVFAFAFTIAFCAPLFGAVVLWLAVEAASRFPVRDAGAPLALLRAPEHAQPSGPREGSYGHGAIRPLLGNPAAPAPRRLKALLALEHVPANRASGLLRRALNDTDEDIRLIAHGILDKREKGVQEAIGRAQAQLGCATGAARSPALRRLAELQWELIYGELATGDVRDHLVSSTRLLVDQALELAPVEPGLWFMKGRLALERGDGAEAERCLEQALHCGLPRGRALPWLAEIAFRERRFQRVRACLRELEGAPLESGIGLCVRYWCGACV